MSRKKVLVESRIIVIIVVDINFNIRNSLMD